MGMKYLLNRTKKLQISKTFCLNFDNILKTGEVTTSLSLSLSLSIYIYIYNQIHYERDYLWTLIEACAIESAALFLAPTIKNLKRHAIKIDPFMKLLI